MNRLNDETPEFLVNKAEQDLPVRQKSNASKSCNSAVKRKNVVSKVGGLKKQVRKHGSDPKPSDSEMLAYISVTQPKKGLTRCCIKANVMLAAMKMKQQQRRKKQQEYSYNQQLRL